MEAHSSAGLAECNPHFPHKRDGGGWEGEGRCNKLWKQFAALLFTQLKSLLPAWWGGGIRCLLRYHCISTKLTISPLKVESARLTAERGSARRSSLRGRERTIIVNQTSTGEVPERRGGALNMGFPLADNLYHLELN